MKLMYCDILKERDYQKEIKKRKQEINNAIEKQFFDIDKKRMEEMDKIEKEKELKEQEKNNNVNENKTGGNNADSWGRINSDVDLKDSEYKGSKDVQRMREAMINRTNDPNSKPLDKFFG